MIRSPQALPVLLAWTWIGCTPGASSNLDDCHADSSCFTSTSPRPGTDLPPTPATLPPGQVDCFLDRDGDGFGDRTAAASSFHDSCPDGWAPEATDCDDLEPRDHPGALEICDDRDNDCDPNTHESGLISTAAGNHSSLEQLLSISTDFDTVHICGGTWFPSTLTLPNSLTWTGHEAPGRPLLIAPSDGPLINTNAPQTWRGIDIVGADQTCMHTTAALEVQSSTITGCSQAIVCDNCQTLSLTNVELSDNTSPGVGAAVSCIGEADVEIIDSYLHHNSAFAGGAVGTRCTTLTVSGGRWEHNDAAAGGALVAQAQTITMATTAFQQNSASQAAAAWVLDADQIDVTNVVLVDNVGDEVTFNTGRDLHFNNLTFESTPSATTVSTPMSFISAPSSDATVHINNLTTPNANPAITVAPGYTLQLQNSDFQSGISVQMGPHACLEAANNSWSNALLLLANGTIPPPNEAEFICNSEECGSVACDLKIPCFPDEDADGAGAQVAPVYRLSCDANMVPISGDCDDHNANVGPDIPGTCTSWCDEQSGCYLDDDNDGYGRSEACLPPLPDGTCSDRVTNDQDCNDNEPDVFPGAPEVHCDGFVNNCSEDPSGREPAFLADGTRYTTLADAAINGSLIEICPGEHAIPAFEFGGPMILASQATGVTVLTPADRVSAGPFLSSNEPLTLRGLTLNGHNAPQTALFTSDELTLENTTVRNFGARAILGDYATLDFTDSHITGNGGGLSCDPCGNVTISGGSWTDNVTSENGGALHIDPSDLFIDHVLFEGNQAHNGGAIDLIDHLGPASTVVIQNSTFRSNTAQIQAGAARLQNLSDEHTLLTGNHWSMNQSDNATLVLQGPTTVSMDVFLENPGIPAIRGDTEVLSLQGVGLTGDAPLILTEGASVSLQDTLLQATGTAAVLDLAVSDHYDLENVTFLSGDHVRMQPGSCLSSDGDTEWNNTFLQNSNNILSIIQGMPNLCDGTVCSTHEVTCSLAP